MGRMQSFRNFGNWFRASEDAFNNKNRTKTNIKTAMKFIVSSTALSSHLQAISRVINSKNALPILDCFLFELEDGTLSVTVSDS